MEMEMEMEERADQRVNAMHSKEVGFAIVRLERFEVEVRLCHRQVGGVATACALSEPNAADDEYNGWSADTTLSQLRFELFLSFFPKI